MAETVSNEGQGGEYAAPAKLLPRIAAFAIDVAILWAITFAIAWASPAILAPHPIIARFIGFAICLGYFACFESNFGKGQTPGKRLLKIRVTSLSGEVIGIGPACLRATPFALLILFSSWFLPLEWVADNLGKAIYSGVIQGVIIACLYLLLFNRQNRRTIPDLLSSSWVVRSGASDVPTNSNVSRNSWMGMSITVSVIVGLYIAIWVSISEYTFPVYLGPAPDHSTGNLRADEINLFLTHKEENSPSPVPEIFIIAVILADPKDNTQAFAGKVGYEMFKHLNGEAETIRVELKYGVDTGLGSYVSRLKCDFKSISDILSAKLGEMSDQQRVKFFADQGECTTE